MITNKEFALFKRRVKRDRGIDLSYYKESFVERRVIYRIHKKDISAMEYINSLDSEEYPRLFDALAINVSEFFRDKPVFEFFSDIILPNLVYYKEETKRKTIRIWSAGCAFGEEPYTIAIILKEFFGKKADFLIQEMNREINTIGSKANHSQISQIVIEIKSELEKIREQVQNIE